ncbi:hypothetical protein [Nocardia sp. NPDC057272]|uniref:hypothetical protein n=1 Tax=Nocardia sp. NPDC057272 TaxID=3346079 RepID=UPI003628E0D4
MRMQVIEIVQNSPAWWQAWLPLLGSIVVASAAFTGVLVSNRTNRKAIAAADARDARQWQKEKCHEAAVSLIEHSAFLLRNLQRFHGDLILDIRHFGDLNQLDNATSFDFFFKDSHSALKTIADRMMSIYDAEASLQVVAPDPVVEAAGDLVAIIRRAEASQRAGMRHYYLLLVSDAKGKSDIKHKDKWLFHEGKYLEMIKQGFLACQEFVTIFREAVSDVEALKRAASLVEDPRKLVDELEASYVFNHGFIHSVRVSGPSGRPAEAEGAAGVGPAEAEGAAGVGPAEAEGAAEVEPAEAETAAGATPKG